MVPLIMREKLCECGCGQVTRIAPYAFPERSWVKGEPERFVNGHNRRRKKRFKIEDRGYETPCHIWQLAIGSTGYGLERVGKRQQMAHRAAWERKNGQIPPGLHLDHLCRVPECVNPNHLEPVTPAENVRRGRAVKLTTEKVREIRALSARGVDRAQIAMRYDIARSYVQRIVKAQIWKEA